MGSLQVLIITCIFLIIGFFSGLRGEDNLVFKKPVVVNYIPSQVNDSNDGDPKSCMFLNTLSFLYVVYDLQQIASIEKLKISVSFHRNKQPVKLLVGDEFHSCRFSKQMKNYRVCSDNVLLDQSNNEIECQGGGVKGRYLALVYGDPDSIEAVKDFAFCELEAFGKVIGAASESSRPELQNENVPKIDKSNFKFINQLREGLPSIEVWRYSNSLVKINKNCEPIIWDPKWNLTFGLACETSPNKGRALFFGYEWFFWYKVFEGSPEFKRNFYRFLSPNNPNPNYLATGKMMTIEELKANVKDGDIIDFDTYKEYPDGYIEELLSMVDSGKAGLVFDHSLKEIENEKSKIGYNKILDHYNIAFISTFFTFSSTGKYTAEEADLTENFIDLEDRLERASKNHQELMKTGDNIVDLMEQMGPEITSRCKKCNKYIGDILKKYYKVLDYNCPCNINPVSTKEDKTIVRLLGVLAERQSNADSNYKLPCIDVFPGDYDKSKPQNVDSVTLEIYGEILETKNPLGYYLPAGQTLEYEVISQEGSWRMDIGCPTDQLAKKRDTWLRYPDIYINDLKINKKGKFFTATGGALWLINEKADSKIQIKLKNVAETPFFNLHDSNAVENWDKNERKKTGIWSQLAGQDFIICGESKFIVVYTGEEIKTLMESWDKVIRNNYAYKGEDWRKYRPEQVVIDIQTSAGYAHSGYPVSTWHDWYVNIVNMKYIREKGSWGMCHELGHNRQDSIWSWWAVQETSNNIFCFLNFEKVWNLTRYALTKDTLKYWEMDKLKTYLNSNAPYNVWVDDTTVSLFMYAHLSNHFGLNFFHRVFIYYRDNAKSLSADSDEKKFDLWIRITSEVTKMNLTPLYTFWGIPVEDSTAEELKKYPCFIPDDYMMEINPSRKELIHKKFPGCTSTPTFNETYDAEKYNQGNRPNFIKKI